MLELPVCADRSRPTSLSFLIFPESTYIIDCNISDICICAGGLYDSETQDIYIGYCPCGACDLDRLG